MLRTAFYFIPSVMTGFIVSVFPFRNRVSSKEAFEVLELSAGKRSRPVLRGPGGRKAARLLGQVDSLIGNVRLRTSQDLPHILNEPSRTPISNRVFATLNL